MRGRGEISRWHSRLDCAGGDRRRHDHVVRSVVAGQLRVAVAAEPVQIDDLRGREAVGAKAAGNLVELVTQPLKLPNGRVHAGLRHVAEAL